ncbi:hypothetical protein [Streptomyces niger]|uniref:hypothetical protein n=1 Tax=Streptomyces niger TaxID=66373 RepID=UPI0006995670|nr:hypothetical protein [Streptomyces niger]
MSSCACRDCPEQRARSRRCHIGVVRAHLEQTERHGRCSREPYVRERERAHGVHRFGMEFVDAALAAQERRPTSGEDAG